MRAWDILRSRLHSIFFHGGRESDLNEGLQFHLERETERVEATGLSREDARLQALRLFGGVEQIDSVAGARIGLGYRVSFTGPAPSTCALSYPRNASPFIKRRKSARVAPQ